MPACTECGANVAPGENFCGNCGSQVPPLSAELKTISATLEQIEEAAALTSPPAPEVEVGKELATTDQTELPPSMASDSPEESAEDPSSGISSSSLGGSSTDDVRVAATTSTPKKGTTGGHHPNVKQLEAGTVLNGRYEIVRRIGGGGMGAVYLAKDRNLGDGPRAVKEMVESHLDPTQHEKAIGDFKRESLLLTALEHPRIPTIYDYFYDEPLSRFYL